MKKILCIVFIACLNTQVNAQIIIAILFGDKLNTGKLEFGIVVTPTLSGITNLESNPKTGINLGIYFNIHPDNKFFLHVEGIAKGTFGAKDIFPYPTGSDSLDNLFAHGSVLRKIKAFSLPILGRYTVTKKFFIEAGIQPDMMLGAKDEFKAKVNDNELTYVIKVGDQVSLLDFGVTGGLFYRFRSDRRSMGIGIRYFQGLTDILPSISGTQANVQWQLNITIPIGAGKSNSEHASKK